MCRPPTAASRRKNHEAHRPLCRWWQRRASVEHVNAKQFDSDRSLTGFCVFPLGSTTLKCEMAQPSPAGVSGRAGASQDKLGPKAEALWACRLNICCLSLFIGFPDLKCFAGAAVRQNAGLAAAAAAGDKLCT